MPKRGERMPWKVIYKWDSGIKGVIACASESSAQLKAAEIQRNAELQDRDVSVMVEER